MRTGVEVGWGGISWMDLA